MKLFLIGFLSGIISGMGIGGGTILIPGLIIFSNLNQHQAQGINLAVFIPIATVALITHSRKKNIDLSTAAPIIFTGLIGAFIGSSIAVKMTPSFLRKVFAAFLFIMGAYETFGKKKK
ncbi:sulfite exporter TauE/SafE family protein [Proteiniborus sp. MB09-C3]|uniref:sulfite exporter TauE/SafE family protein n=1 Tax=Proteiniborus sp. MB09-C3 TaxID=3050072 RepID=UPI002557319F|nr:sulfite exporter TauE/SafE family protein [Proteiniborus sp. MB09-C3]WIV10734.1 sulfite exporter TauE/SafE family protein [Proteiniborus sp. MB09-C3]